jgi:hypothetical protein
VQSSLVVSERGRDASSIAGRFFRLAQFEVALTGVSRLGWVHARTESRLFKEEAPPFVGICRTLPILIFAHRGFRIRAALDHFDYSSGHIGTHVVTDQHVGRFCVVVYQRGLQVREFVIVISRS